ncbi:MAG: nitroreductase family deazaflavin-dependent oxidoreductase [Acidimicrobiales bacterium]
MVPQGGAQGGAAHRPLPAQGERRPHHREQGPRAEHGAHHHRSALGPAAQTPLACVPQPDGTGWWVVGSNFGREQHPAWTGNLIAEPRAQVSYEGRRSEVTARLLDDAEKEAIRPTLTGAWPAYQVYVQSSGRNLRVFDLQPS